MVYFTWREVTERNQGRRHVERGKKGNERRYRNEKGVLYFALKEMTERNQGQSKKKNFKRGRTNEGTEMERCLLLGMNRGDCTK